MKPIYTLKTYIFLSSTLTCSKKYFTIEGNLFTTFKKIFSLHCKKFYASS